MIGLVSTLNREKKERNPVGREHEPAVVEDAAGDAVATDAAPPVVAESAEMGGDPRRAARLVEEVLARIQERRTWSATYRLQMRKEFGYASAGAIADYLAALGVSHVYSSPQLQSRSGSARLRW